MNKQIKKSLLCLLVAGYSQANAQTLQTQFTDLIQQRRDALAYLLTGLPISDFNYELTAFTPKTSNAKTQLSYTLPDGKTKYQIDSTAMITEGNGDIVFSTRETFLPNNQLSNELQLFLMRSEIRAKRLQSGATNTLFIAKPTHYFTENKESTNFEGMTLTLNHDIKNNQQFNFDYRGFKQFGTIRDYEIKPFNIMGRSLASGKFSFNSTPIEFIGSKKEKKVYLHLDKLSGKGDLKKHTESDIMLGNIDIKLENVTLDGQNRVELKEFDYRAEAKLTAENRMRQSQTVKIIANQESILKMTYNQFGFSTAKIDITLSNISPQGLKRYGDSLRNQANINTASPEMMTELFAIVKSIRETNTSVNINLDISSSNGPIKLIAMARFNESGPTLSSMMASQDPKAFLKLANFDISITLPKEMVDTVGMAAPMPLQMFMKPQGNSYVAKIKNSNGALTINGQPAPF